MSKIQILQCKKCNGYDDELNKDGFCINCEETVHEHDYKFTNEAEEENYKQWLMGDKEDEDMYSIYLENDSVYDNLQDDPFEDSYLYEMDCELDYDHDRPFDFKL